MAGIFDVAAQTLSNAALTGAEAGTSMIKEQSLKRLEAMVTQYNAYQSYGWNAGYEVARQFDGFVQEAEREGKIKNATDFDTWKQNISNNFLRNADGSFYINAEGLKQSGIPLTPKLLGSLSYAPVRQFVGSDGYKQMSDMYDKVAAVQFAQASQKTAGMDSKEWAAIVKDVEDNNSAQNIEVEKAISDVVGHTLSNPKKEFLKSRGKEDETYINQANQKITAMLAKGNTGASKDVYAALEADANLGKGGALNLYEMSDSEKLAYAAKGVFADSELTPNSELIKNMEAKGIGNITIQKQNAKGEMETIINPLALLQFKAMSGDYIGARKGLQQLETNQRSLKVLGEAQKSLMGLRERGAIKDEEMINKFVRLIPIISIWHPIYAKQFAENAAVGPKPSSTQKAVENIKSNIGEVKGAYQNLETKVGEAAENPPTGILPKDVEAENMNILYGAADEYLDEDVKDNTGTALYQGVQTK